MKIIKCKGEMDGKVCNNEYATKKDPKAKLNHDRPQCFKCGTRA